MSSKKEEYTKIASEWLKDFLIKTYSDKYNIKIIIPNTNISNMEVEEIKRYPNYSLMDFYPDVMGILASKNKKDNIKLVLLNRSTNPISVKEIGEMNIYSNIAKPEASFIVSLKGLPSEVNSLLLNENICSSLLNYEDKSIIILRLNQDGIIDSKVTFPRNFKNVF